MSAAGPVRLIAGVAALALTVLVTACSAAPPPATRPAPRPTAVRSTRGTPRPARPVRVLGPTSPAACPAAPYGAQRYAPDASKVSTAKTVALTFDDGPGRSTGAVIDILRRYRVPATFFNIGQAMATRPYLVQEEVQDGFAMGNHSWNHPHLTTLPALQQGTEISQASAEQRRIAGTVPCAFRPPYGEYDMTTLTLAQQQRLGVWLWSNDTLDWMANGANSPYWVQRIIRLAEQGSTLSHPILLMHNARAGDPATVAALPTIIEFFRARGYLFVAL
jgi:peptidoglycan/xylan/chitin deacetylase (PgdA/CDA1 family)